MTSATGFRPEILSGVWIRLVEPLVNAPTDSRRSFGRMGAIAIERLKAGLIESLELDALPGLVRAGRA